MSENPVKCPCRWKNCKRYGDCEACKEHHHCYEKVPETTCERNARRKAEKAAEKAKAKKANCDEGCCK